MLVIYDAVMRLPLTLLAGYFLWREWGALEAAQGWLKVSAHVATMLFLALIAVMTLAQLGRSFSVMPEARTLVTAGLYSRIRHPLYMAEAVATLGVFLQYRSLGAALLVAAQFAVQLWRMHEEEKVLEAQFPDYAGYRARTARLLPGVY